MEMAQLNVKLRTGAGKGDARKLRASGWSPAVVYGFGKPSLQVSLRPTDLATVLRVSPNRRNTVMELQVEGGGSHPVLLQEMQVHPVTREVLHVDFLNVDFNALMRCDVPVKLDGRAEGVKAGGLLQPLVRTVRIECLPAAIPKEIVVDVTHLQRKETLRVEDVKAPEGVRIVFTENFGVAVVS